MDAHTFDEVSNVDAIDNTIVDLWPSLRESGDLYVDENGLLAVNSDNKYTGLPEYASFLDTVALCNESIRNGILTVDRDTVQLSTVENLDIPIPDSIMNNRPLDIMNTQPIDITNNDSEIMPYGAAHGCSVPALNLINLCETNYQTLVDYFNEMFKLKPYNPGLNPWSATTSYWILKVAPGGDWDYKSKEGYAPYNKLFCCYLDGSYQHVTSEYIGNFNYGYTGSYLFTLNLLHTGSSAVSGFDPADEDDWPAIDDGYYAKVNG